MCDLESFLDFEIVNKSTVVYVSSCSRNFDVLLRALRTRKNI